MNSEIHTYVEAYENSTNRFESLVVGLSESVIDVKHPEGWSSRQIIHHVADSEAQSYARFRRLIAEPLGSVIQGYDEAAWAENAVLGYEHIPVTNSIAVFRSVRLATLDLIRRLSPDDLTRYGEHSESGRYSVVTWFENYVRHPEEHAEQIERALKGLL